MKKIYFSIITILLIFLLSVQRLSATAYNLKAGGNITTLADWGSNPAGTTGTPVSFSGNHTWNLATNNTNLTLSTTWGLSGVTPAVIIGSGTGFTLVLASGGQIGTTPTNINLTFNNNSVFRLKTPYGFNPGRTTINTGSTFIYEAGSQTSPVGGDTYYNLEIEGGLTIDLNGNTVVVTNNLNLNTACVLQLNAGQLDLKNTISGAGVLSDNASGGQLLLEGTGAIGTLNFDAVDNNVSNFILSLGTAASSAILGTDLNIDGGVLQLNNGKLDLNGNVLRVQNTSSADFSGGGTIIGSAASTLSISASAGGAGIAGSLLMDATNNNLKALVLNSNGETLTLGSQLNILDFLQVDDGTLVTGGNLTLKASNLLSARVGSIGATGAISGNVTVETFIPGNSTGWALWGANGVNGLTVNTWNAEIPMTCENCLPYGVTGAGGYYFESVQGWDESVTTSGQEYDTTIVAGTNLTAGRGFWVYVGSGQSTTSDFTLNHSGSLVTSAVSIPVTDAGNGFNLISNPYASPISWTAVYNANSSVGLLGGTIYGYNADGGGVVSSYNAGAGSGGSNVIGDVIPAGQAFFVDMSNFGLCGGGCSIVIDESMKVSNNTNANPVIRTTSAASNTNAMFNLKINGTTGDYDQTQFRVIPSATSNFDRRWDGYKIFQTPGYAGYPGAYTKYTTISSRMNNIDYSINSLGALTHSIAVPVLVRVSTTGSYTITASDFVNYSSCIVLKDKLTNTLTDLKVSSYVFNISDTTSTPRFELLMCEEGNTTVSLTELKANSGNVQIKQDELGAFVDTHFEKNTKATISVYNVMGQQLMKDVLVEGTDTSTRLNLDAHNQVLIIKVTADKETTTKKIIAH